MSRTFVDADVRRRLPPAVSRAVVRAFLADPDSASPVRVCVGDPPRTVLSRGMTDSLTGFRAYREGDIDESVTVVWHRSGGTVAGVVVGDALGEVRTAALGGVALECCLRAEMPEVVTVIGAGRQAVAHLEQLTSLWPSARFFVHGRSDTRAQSLAARLRARTFDCVAGHSVAASLRMSSVAVLATSSREPVATRGDLEHLQHVSTLGPKAADAHELPPEHDVGRRVLTDSVEQLRVYPGGSAIDPATRTVLDLADLIRGVASTPADGTPTTYVSVGRTGAEIALVAALLRDVTSQLFEEKP